MVDKIEALIKKYLENKVNPTGGTREDADYPTPLDLYRYVHQQLIGSEFERMLSFLRHNKDGQELVLRAREIMQDDEEWKKESVRPELIQDAKALMGKKTKEVHCPHCGKKITPFKTPPLSQKWRNLAWLFLAVASLGMSFIFRRYFIQCLVVTTLAGVKCIVEMRATKTQILIYKALSDQDPSEQHRLHTHSSHL